MTRVAVSRNQETRVVGCRLEKRVRVSRSEVAVSDNEVVFRDLAGDLEARSRSVKGPCPRRVGMGGRWAGRRQGCRDALWAVGRTELHRSRESVHGRSQINGYNPLGMYCVFWRRKRREREMRGVGWPFLFGGLLLLHTAQRAEGRRSEGQGSSSSWSHQFRSSPSAPVRQLARHAIPGSGVLEDKRTARPGVFLEAQRSTASCRTLRIRISHGSIFHLQHPARWKKRTTDF